MSEALEQLKQTIEDHRWVFTKAGITEEQLIHATDYRVDHGALIPVLGRLILDEVSAWRSVRAATDECIWDWYEAYGERKQVEAVRLSEAAKQVRTAWKQRISPFWKEAKKRVK